MSSALEQRPFGRTGEKVSVIGLGGAALYKHSYELGVATVKHALDLGVSYFDTSPAYGRAGAHGSWTDRGMSQLIMGEGLDGTTRPNLLATKLINYTTDVRGSTSRSPVAANPIGYRTVEDCRAQLFDNLRALRRDRVDVLLGHDIRELSTILVGASTPEEIEENVVAAQAGPLPPDIHQALEGLHEEENIQEA
ncbi:MAG: hypothetical protein F4Y49_12160 [Dehalococcoidia bacterium]|nr:hypothetical protein [Dehalococcoidia bacterium]